MKKLVLALLVVLLANSAFTQENKELPPPQLSVLVFSKTSGFRHNSIANGLKMMSELAQENNWNLTATENSKLFTTDFLMNFDVVVFLNPTGDVLNNNQQKAFTSFLNTGKGFVGIHAAADCEYDWDWFGKLNGAYFLTHPPAQEGTVIFEDTNHPAMEVFKGMKSYTTFDEWYSFKANPREKVHVLARLDESSIKIADNDKWKMGDHPLIWWQEYDNIRSFYTVFGHTPEAFDDVKVKKHISDAVEWAGKRK
ncbi:ThuA domain-containing protein [Gaoshiqia sediminis]|uniref:ThuA domain-containing protein n=1 Tax=Gaoshiqia sediminis TaxID=2986998 RepID=A0AA42C616_9BACT|nr:ThuA domain-containing protein [Gaoshiqia sediminis]MCW0482089.1 ThuA domain-containing protein [Gaoshiqia sediminis]